jgi:hypothetical protein
VVTADRLHVSTGEFGNTLSCRVSEDEGKPISLWIASSDLEAPKAWEPFLPVLALYSWSRGHSLALEGEVSAELIRGSSKALGVYTSWGLSHPQDAAWGVRPRREQAVPRSAPSAAAFFSGGVDSFYTLIRNHSKYPSGHPRRIRTLLLLQGLDISLDDPSLFDQVRAAARTVATRFGCRLVCIATNARLLTVGVDWVAYGHAPCLMAAAHFVAASNDAVYVPAAYAADEVQPNAVHPVTDHLWSSEGLDVVHDGADASRGEKVALISKTPEALAHLRVCWRNPEGAYNCGRCEKCLRTMFDLSISGALRACPAFSNADLADGLNQVIIPPHLTTFWQRSVYRALEAGADPIIIERARHALERSVFDHSSLGQGFESGYRILERLGISRAVLKGLDSKLFGGAGHKLIGRLHGRASRTDRRPPPRPDGES